MARVHSTEESRDEIPEHEFEVEREVLQVADEDLVDAVTSDEKPAKRGRAFVEETEEGITFGVQR